MLCMLKILMHLAKYCYINMTHVTEIQNMHSSIVKTFSTFQLFLEWTFLCIPVFKYRFRPFQILFLFPVLFFTENLPSLQEKKRPQSYTAARNLSSYNYPPIGQNKVEHENIFFLIEGQKPTLPRTRNKNKNWNGLSTGRGNRIHAVKPRLSLTLISGNFVMQAQNLP